MPFSVAAVALGVTSLVLINSAPTGVHHAFAFSPFTWLCLVLSTVFGLAGPVLSLVGLSLGGRKGTTVTCFILSLVFSIALLPIFLIVFVIFYIEAFSF